MQEQVKDIVVRAVKTFLQAFISALMVANLTDFDSVKAAVIAAGAAGVSAVWNTLLATRKTGK